MLKGIDKKERANLGKLTHITITIRMYFFELTLINIRRIKNKLNICIQQSNSPQKF
jgi:hypothetical protein